MIRTDDRGDDFYEWFLGPRMIYTSGVISDPNKDETLEQLQDNKLAIVCEKLALKPEDRRVRIADLPRSSSSHLAHRLLDIGCGWGTLAAFAGKNYNCDVTGVTLARNQTKFGNDRLRKNGVSEEKGRILCNDYRELATAGKRYSKIVSLESVAQPCFSLRILREPSQNVRTHRRQACAFASLIGHDRA